ncbi:MAG: hypothetical protein GX410_06660 [Elusimicrobia bacterium]|nr:hypothetical protein [Elusimicrobiota bacterium]
MKHIRQAAVSGAILLAAALSSAPAVFCAQAAKPASEKPRYPQGPKAPEGYTFLPAYENLSFTQDDLVILYFFAPVREAFAARGWTCKKIASGNDGGLRLCSGKEAKGRAVIGRPFFGEDAPARLDPLFRRGARRFVTLSKAADLSDTLPLGGLAAPSTLVSEEGKPLPNSKNYAQDWFGPQLPGLPQTPHGWVLSPYDKTVNCLKTMRGGGAVTMDLRHGYFSRWLEQNPQAQGAAFLVVSYYPLGRDIDDHFTRKYGAETDAGALKALKAMAAALSAQAGDSK